MNQQRTQRFQRLRAHEVSDWCRAHPDALILDARDLAHHERGHLSGSLRLDGRNHERLLTREDRARPVFIYCYHGNASQTYAEMFADFGFAQVVDLIGGWEAWMQQGRSAQTVSGELQAWLDAEGFIDAVTSGAHGNTPLMHAAWRGRLDIVEALLALNVPPNAVNADGNNALWLGCVSNQSEIVRRLVAAGVPIDHANLTGATSLMYAASSSKPEIVRTLLELGADASIQTQDDFTALDMAASLPCLQLLRAAERSAS